MAGRSEAGAMASVRISPEGTQALDYGLDATPALLVSGLFTVRGGALRKLLRRPFCSWSFAAQSYFERFVGKKDLCRLTHTHIV